MNILGASGSVSDVTRVTKGFLEQDARLIDLYFYSDPDLEPLGGLLLPKKLLGARFGHLS